MFIGYCSDLFAHTGTDPGTSLRRALSVFAPLGLLAAAGYAVAGFCASSRRTNELNTDLSAAKTAADVPPA
jgi:hypothetical protein